MSIVGIDLGTTNSLISVYRDGIIEQIPNSFGDLLTPSVVSFDKDGKVYVGKIAKERKITNPESTISSFKTFMGTDKKYNIYGKMYTPEDLSAIVISQLIEDAKRYLKEDIKEAIISVPAYFNNKQRNATKKAGEIAGIKVERLINEPSAAAAFYYISSNEKQTFLVFDFGGGTLDISIVDAFENIIEVVSIVGDNHLGGNDFDLIIAKEICNQNGYEWENISSENKGKLLKEAEKCKILLNTEKEAIVKTIIDEKEIKGVMTRKHLIEISTDIFLKIQKLIKKILRDSELSLYDVDNILLVGGSSNMKVVQDYISYITNKNLLYEFKPDLLVGLGVGVVAGIKERKEELRDIVMTDVCPFSLGVGTHNEANSNESIFSPIIERNTTLPVSKTHIYETIVDNQKKVTFEIFQGENYCCSDNLLIGVIEMQVPPAPKGKEKVEVRFTYNINGILEVEVKVLSTNEVKKMYIQNDETNYTDEEMKKIMQDIRDNQRYDEEDIIYTIELGKRLYKETMGETREIIEQMVKRLEYEKEKQNEFKLRKICRQSKEFFERISLSIEDIEINEDFFKEFIENEDDEDEDNLDDFTSGYTD